MFSIKLKGNDNLPDWVKFNKNTREISGYGPKLEKIIDFIYLIDDGVTPAIS